MVATPAEVRSLCQRKGPERRRHHCKFAVPSRGYARRSCGRKRVRAPAACDVGALPTQGLRASPGRGRARLPGTPALPIATPGPGAAADPYTSAARELPACPGGWSGVVRGRGLLPRRLSQADSARLTLSFIQTSPRNRVCGSRPPDYVSGFHTHRHRPSERVVARSIGFAYTGRDMSASASRGDRLPRDAAGHLELNEGRVACNRIKRPCSLTPS